MFVEQVTINCAERGLLLLRVRDEIRMTIAAYQTLYESRSVIAAVSCAWCLSMRSRRKYCRFCVRYARDSITWLLSLLICVLCCEDWSILFMQSTSSTVCCHPSARCFANPVLDVSSFAHSVAFGMRKALQAEQGKSDMENRIVQLEADKKDLERQIQDLKAKCEAIEKRESERRQLDEKKHAEEVQFLKRTNAQLKTQLENILAPSAAAPAKK